MRDPHRVDDAEFRRGRKGRIVPARSVLVLHRATEGRRQFLTRLREVLSLGRLPYAPQWRLYKPVVASNTMIRWLTLTVGYVQLVGRRIDDHVRGCAKILRVVAATALPLMPDLQ